MSGGHDRPRRSRRAAREFGTAPAIADGDVRLTFAELLERVRDCGRVPDRPRRRSPATGSQCGRRTRTTGSSPRSARTTPARRSCRSTRRYTGHEAARHPAAHATRRAGRHRPVPRRRPAGATSSAAAARAAARCARSSRIPHRRHPPTPDDVARLGRIAATPSTCHRRGRGARRRGAARRRQRHPVHLRHDRAQQGRAERAPAGRRRRAGLGASAARSTRHDRYLVDQPVLPQLRLQGRASSSACSPARRSCRWRSSTSTARMRLIAARADHRAARRADDLPDDARPSRTRAEYDLSSLRFAVTGAAVVPVALVERMQAELGFDIVLTAFGMTEAVVVTMCRRDDDPPELVARTSRTRHGRVRGPRSATRARCCCAGRT